jgi:hypothetical protein
VIAVVRRGVSLDEAAVSMAAFLGTEGATAPTSPRVGSHFGGLESHLPVWHPHVRRDAPTGRREPSRPRPGADLARRARSSEPSGGDT